MAKVTITLDTEDMTLAEDFKSVGQLVTMLKAATNIPSAPYMTKSEVARFMGLKSVTSVDKWIKKGLPVVKIDGMNLLIKRQTLIDWLAEHETTE
ncbi:hypothetical protein [Ligilactobacillus murinus]|uniref:DNA-binding protein n=1 Tax=Ligilactobacillus murinus TaxID=1622 RepID=A0AAD0P7Z7_9LACO|nr:hypothetical protein [Ligilactobacillus murinus]AWZ38629.1 hypothetical protein CPS94_06725 [Ligilactobacillus murinus]